MWQLRRPGEGPLVLGHRGASARETENTAAAFRRARTDGADGVELDVLLSATGEVMVFHDDDLARLAGRPERIGDLPYRALREVQLPGGTTIPTLEEALEACGPDLLVNVELKANELGFGPMAALVEAVAEVIARTDSAGRVLVSSFNPWAVHLWMPSGRPPSARRCCSNASRCCRSGAPGWRPGCGRSRCIRSWCSAPRSGWPPGSGGATW